MQRNGFELIYSTPVAGAVGKWEARFAFHFSMARLGNESGTGALPDVCPVVGKIESAFGEEQFRRSFPAECFSRSGIEFPCDLIELFLGKARQVGPLREVLAEKAVNVFADAPFPGSMGMSEIDSDSSVFRQGFVFAHLTALVKGHRKAHLA